MPTLEITQAIIEATIEPETLALNSPRSPETARPHFLAILAVALIARSIVLAVAIEQGASGWIYKQSLELSALAQSLLHGQGLSSPFGGHTGPSAFLAPGYPAIVAIVFWIFGSYTTASAIAIMVLQTTFNMATVVTIMWIAQRLFGNRAANLAGALWAISPVLLWLPVIFWESSLSTFALITIVALALRIADQPTTPRWAFIGLACGLTLLVNPALALVLATILLWAAHRTTSFTRSGPALAVLLCLLVFAPWPIRNLRAFHAFVPFRTNFGYELWQGNRPESKGYFNESLHPNKSLAEHDRYAAIGELGYMRERSQLAQDAIRANPTRFARLTFKRIGSFWTGLGGDTTTSLQVAHTLLTTTFGFAGLILLFRSRHPAALLLALPLLLFPLPYYLTHPDPRFRLVLDPIATILTAYAITELHSRWKQSSRPKYSCF